MKLQEALEFAIIDDKTESKFPASFPFIKDLSGLINVKHPE